MDVWQMHRLVKFEHPLVLLVLQSQQVTMSLPIVQDQHELV